MDDGSLSGKDSVFTDKQIEEALSASIKLCRQDDSFWSTGLLIDLAAKRLIEEYGQHNNSSPEKRLSLILVSHDIASRMGERENLLRRMYPLQKSELINFKLYTILELALIYSGISPLIISLPLRLLFDSKSSDFKESESEIKSFYANDGSIKVEDKYTRKGIKRVVANIDAMKRALMEQSSTSQSAASDQEYITDYYTLPFLSKTATLISLAIDSGDLKNTKDNFEYPKVKLCDFLEWANKNPEFPFIHESAREIIDYTCKASPSDYMKLLAFFRNKFFSDVNKNITAKNLLEKIIGSAIDKRDCGRQSFFIFKIDGDKEILAARNLLDSMVTIIRGSERSFPTLPKSKHSLRDLS